MNLSYTRVTKREGISRRNFNFCKRVILDKGKEHVREICKDEYINGLKNHEKSWVSMTLSSKENLGYLINNSSSISYIKLNNEGWSLFKLGCDHIIRGFGAVDMIDHGTDLTLTDNPMELYTISGNLYDRNDNNDFGFFVRRKSNGLFKGVVNMDRQVWNLDNCPFKCMRKVIKELGGGSIKWSGKYFDARNNQRSEIFNSIFGLRKEDVISKIENIDNVVTKAREEKDSKKLESYYDETASLTESSSSEQKEDECVGCGDPWPTGCKCHPMLCEACLMLVKHDRSCYRGISNTNKSKAKRNLLSEFSSEIKQSDYMEPTISLIYSKYTKLGEENGVNNSYDNFEQSLFLKLDELMTERKKYLMKGLTIMETKNKEEWTKECLTPETSKMKRIMEIEVDDLSEGKFIIESMLDPLSMA